MYAADNVTMLFAVYV